MDLRDQLQRTLGTASAREREIQTAAALQQAFIVFGAGAKRPAAVHTHSGRSREGGFKAALPRMYGVSTLGS